MRVRTGSSCRNDFMVGKYNEFYMSRLMENANLENCFVETSVTLGPRCVIWPYVTLDGDAEIGEGTEIGKGATISGKLRIGKNVKIAHNVHITGEGYIGDNTEIGHDIHNPKIGANCLIDAVIVDSTISDNCIIGTRGLAVVERSFIGTGVKAKHACGIRDAYLDYDVNISEFVTFANLASGVKNKTKVGSRTMIGVSVRIMGGSQIGEECYIADGSRVDGIIESRVYYNPGRALKEPHFAPMRALCSWYIAGNYMPLNQPIGVEPRFRFTEKAMKLCGDNRETLRNWLKAPLAHAGSRTPLQLIRSEGEKAFEIIFSD